MRKRTQSFYRFLRSGRRRGCFSRVDLRLEKDIPDDDGGDDDAAADDADDDQVGYH